MKVLKAGWEDRLIAGADGDPLLHARATSMHQGAGATSQVLDAACSCTAALAQCDRRDVQR